MPGKPELFREGSASSQTIGSGGALVLLQEQDAYCKPTLNPDIRSAAGTIPLLRTYNYSCLLVDQLDANQILMGELGDFQMWDYVMTSEDVATLTCGDEGNVISWDTMKTAGNPEFKDIAVPSHVVLGGYSIYP